MLNCKMLILSVVEALKHAGYAFDSDVEIKWINAEEVKAENVAELLDDVDGILVPGGFGDRGIEGKIAAIQYAREKKRPFFGICLGMQLASIEFARNVLGLEGAHLLKLIQKHHIQLLIYFQNKRILKNLVELFVLGYIHVSCLKVQKLMKPIKMKLCMNVIVIVMSLIINIVKRWKKSRIYLLWYKP